MNLNIGAKKPIDGTQVFLVGRHASPADVPFVLLYDADKQRRAKRNVQKIDPVQVVTAMGVDQFTEIQYPGWGTVWFRTAKIRCLRALTAEELRHSPEQLGSMVLFVHDPEPEDAHAGFLLFGMDTQTVSHLLHRAGA